MSVIKLSSGKSFQASREISILDSATDAHISLPYSCKTGRCSTCRCKVMSGITNVLQRETGLTEQEKAEGWILSCARSAETDLLIEVDDLGGVASPSVKTLPCRISQISKMAPDVVQVFLRFPPAAEFDFVPGQYIDIIGSGGIRRSYSLANSDFTSKVLELHIRAVEGGAMSDYWFNQAKPNDLLRLNGPLGTFFLRKTANIDLIFLATGTGIAPVKSMLDSLSNLQPDQRPRTVTVVWGGRRPEDLYLDMTIIPENCTYIPVQSRPDAGWSGAKGYVQDVLLNLEPDLKNAFVYACGSDSMIRSAKVRLVEAGLPANRFYSDSFVSSGKN